MRLYFRDNLFNAGETRIMNEQQAEVGTVDLRSSFGSALDVFDGSGKRKFGGKFPLLSNRWIVTDSHGEECGELRYRLSFLSKRYEYDAYGRGVYEITSPAFSREYEIYGADGRQAASFSKVNGWLEASAYCLDNHAGEMDSFEWIAVILGMHEIQKRHQSHH